MKVLVLANFGMGLYNFRKELLEKLIEKGFEVYISLPKDEYVSKLEAIGCKFVNTQLERRGTNPISDFKLLLHYLKLVKQIKPDVVLTYTIKPNVYGGIVCTLENVPYIANVTGLGTAIENRGLFKKVTMQLYKMGLKKSACTFFQNEANKQFFIANSIVKGKVRLIPGSGVNLIEHKFEEFPATEKPLKLLFIGRIMKAKGIDELLNAAKVIKKKYQHVEFHLVGGSEEDYSQTLEELERENIIVYHGLQEDVHPFIKNSHAIILPSYHEGLANVLLESSSTGRPVLASRIPGCIETFDEGITGIGFEAKNVESLVGAIKKFIELPYERKKEMGLAARKKMENKFNRTIVVNAYLDEIKLIKESRNEAI